jgi:tyrosyl-tRNA synthetase
MADKTTLDANAQSRFDLINENLAEIMNPEIIKGILAEGKNPRV